jgi:hypothetical protein
MLHSAPHSSTICFLQVPLIKMTHQYTLHPSARIIKATLVSFACQTNSACHCAIPFTSSIAKTRPIKPAVTVGSPKKWKTYVQGLLPGIRGRRIYRHFHNCFQTWTRVCICLGAGRRLYTSGSLGRPVHMRHVPLDAEEAMSIVEILLHL